MPDAVTAARQLEGAVVLPIREVDLPDLRRIHRFAGRAAVALLDGDLPRPDVLNELAADSSAHLRLIAGDGSLDQKLVWDDVSAVGQLARRLIEELSSLEPTRLRRCAGRPCNLLFYDSTRSRTQRWHAENPCGWRERQRCLRARTLTDLDH